MLIITVVKNVSSISNEMQSDMDTDSMNQKSSVNQSWLTTSNQNLSHNRSPNFNDKNGSLRQDGDTFKTVHLDNTDEELASLKQSTSKSLSNASFLGRRKMHKSLARSITRIDLI